MRHRKEKRASDTRTIAGSVREVSLIDDPIGSLDFRWLFVSWLFYSSGNNYISSIVHFITKYGRKEIAGQGGAGLCISPRGGFATFTATQISDQQQSWGYEDDLFKGPGHIRWWPLI